jgi:hypothetical protein
VVEQLDTREVVQPLFGKRSVDHVTPRLIFRGKRVSGLGLRERKLTAPGNDGRKREENSLIRISETKKMQESPRSHVKLHKTTRFFILKLSLGEY